MKRIRAAASKQALAAVTLAFALALPATAQAQYNRPPSSGDSWYWEIDPPEAGPAGLPPTSATYPRPGSAHILDTDLFEDSNTSSGQNEGIPTGASPVVKAIHAAGHYSICYVEAGAYQTGFPDDSDFAPADYGNKAKRHQLQGYSNEWYLNIAGFKNYVAGHAATLTGAAPNIAAGLGDRFKWCKLEGQDAVEPDDLDGYTNDSATGAAGGGWGLTQQDARGFERWIAYQTHADGLAVFQKNDPADASADEPLFDGVISEECNYYDDPCAGPGGDWDAYLSAGKPVLNAEYAQDGEKTSEFCSTDDRYGIWGALFSDNLDGSVYQPCWNAQNEL